MAWLRKSIIQDNEIFFFGFTCLIIFVSRLPFIFEEYGTDPDAWGVVFAARMISARGGGYYVSRFPGNPLQEYTYSLLWRGGPLVLNGMTALLSGAAAAFLVLSVKKLGGQLPLLTGLAFACIPVVYINSVNSMDYLWAECFVLGSLYFLLKDRAIVSGLFLGLAIGTRITSAAMFLPLGILLFVRSRRKLEVVRFVLTALAVGGTCFLPAFQKYGTSFLKFSEFQKMPLTTVVKLITLDIWGLCGLFVLGVLSIYLLYRVLKPRRVKNIPPHWGIWAMVIGLYSVIYLRLPHESGYLIPILPFFLILLNGWLARRALLFVGLGMMISPFLLGVSLGKLEFRNELLNYNIGLAYGGSRAYVYPFLGPVIEDQVRRSQEVKRFNSILQFGNTVQNKSLIIVGWNIPKFAVLGLSNNQNTDRVTYSDFLSGAEIQRFVSEGYEIYYLPEMAVIGRDVFGVDFHQIGAIPLDDSVLHPSQ